ncbi:hypothetical protein SAMN05216175_1201, partial [Neptunomonas qingdaonensis]
MKVFCWYLLCLSVLTSASNFIFYGDAYFIQRHNMLPTRLWRYMVKPHEQLVLVSSTPR